MGLSQTASSVENDEPSSAELVELPATRPPWRSDEDAWDQVRRIALHRLDQMMNLEPKVLRGNKPGAIHDFRVASRRFQQALDLLLPQDPSKNLLRMRRGVARSRKALSAVRNLDVFIRRADRVLARKRVPRRQAWEAVRGYLGRERDKAFARAVRKIGKLNLARVYVRLRGALAPEALFAGGTAQAEGASLGEGEFREKLSKELAGAWEDFEQASARARNSSATEAIHTARLAVKRLRYLMEIVHEFGKDRSGPVISVSRRLQDRLGEWHDYEVEDKILAGLVARPKFLRKNLGLASELMKLMAQQRRAKERLAAARARAFDAASSEQLKLSVLALTSRKD